jgi:UDP-N-acetylglucosamine--N-acetylmuramyl-(pentapeptide) pyrophosphoryl-undecaprenol N-acetylglucosamine transferase
MGAARVIFDHELDGEILAKNVRELCENPELRLEMARACRSLGRPDAAQKVVEIVMSLIKKREHKGV